MAEIWQFKGKGNTKYNSIHLFKDLSMIRRLVPEETTVVLFPYSKIIDNFI